MLYYTNKTDQDLSFSLPSEMNGIAVISAKNSYISGNKLFSYGPSNGTKGRNRFHNGITNLYDEELNDLGFGILHNSLEKLEEQPIAISENQTINAYSTGVYEIVLNTEVSVESSIQPFYLVKVFPIPFNDNIELEAPRHIQIKKVEISQWDDGRKVLIMNTNSSSNHYQMNTSSILK